MNTSTFDNLPDIISPKDLMRYLPIGKGAIYDLFRPDRLKHFRVGRKIFTTKAHLRHFLGGSVE